MAYWDGQESDEHTVRPEGAECRFSEHVAREIRAGRFERSRFWGMFDCYYICSPDSDRYRFDNAEPGFGPDEYDQKVFELSASRAWYWRKWKMCNYVNLQRGRKDISTLLTPYEVDLLAEAYVKAQEIWKAQETEKQKEAEIKRQRAAWWP